MISEYKGGCLLNRKGEWGHNVPPQFTMEDDRRFQRQLEAKKRDETEEGDSDGRDGNGHKRQRVGVGSVTPKSEFEIANQEDSVRQEGRDRIRETPTVQSGDSLSQEDIRRSGEKQPKGSQILGSFMGENENLDLGLINKSNITNIEGENSLRKQKQNLISGYFRGSEGSGRKSLAAVISTPEGINRMQKRDHSIEFQNLDKTSPEEARS